MCKWLRRLFSCKKKMALQQLSYQEANKFFGPDSSVKYLYHYTTVEVSYPEKSRHIVAARLQTTCRVFCVFVLYLSLREKESPFIFSNC